MSKENTGNLVSLSATFIYENGARQVIKMRVESSAVGNILEDIKSDLMAKSYTYRILK